MIRNSTKFFSYKDLKVVCRDLKEVYAALNAESGHEALEEFGKMERQVSDDSGFMRTEQEQHHGVFQLS